MCGLVDQWNGEGRYSSKLVVVVVVVDGVWTFVWPGCVDVAIWNRCRREVRVECVTWEGHIWGGCASNGNGCGVAMLMVGCGRML